MELLERAEPPSSTLTRRPAAGSRWPYRLLEDARPLAESFLATYSPYDYVVCPSGSCTAMVTHHYDHMLAGQRGLKNSRRKPSSCASS